MAPQRWEVQDVFRLHGAAYRQTHRSTMSADGNKEMQNKELKAARLSSCVRVLAVLLRP